VKAEKAHVISQKPPSPVQELKHGAKINVIVSKGRDS